MGVICEIAAPDADGMYLTDFLSHSHKVRHRAERLTEEIGVKAGYDHANPTVGEFLCDIHKRHVVELGLVYSHHLDFRIMVDDPVVAAASIIARATYIYSMRKLNEECGLELKKGASSAVKAQAVELVKKFGASDLKRFAKLHFKTAAEAVAQAK